MTTQKIEENSILERLVTKLWKYHQKLRNWHRIKEFNSHGLTDMTVNQRKIQIKPPVSLVFS